MNRREGLTLVELMATLLIVSMLAVTALAVCRNMVRGEPARRQQEQVRRAEEGLSRLLEADLATAREFRLLKEGFEVQANSCLGDLGADRRQWPCRVSYVVAPLAGRPSLVRIETPLCQEPPRRLLVCLDVERITLSCPQGEPAASGYLAMKGPVEVTVELKEPPAQVRVGVVKEAKEAP